MRCSEKGELQHQRKSNTAVCMYTVNAVGKPCNQSVPASSKKQHESVKLFLILALLGPSRFVIGRYPPHRPS